jgi:hypothetical protein
MFLGLPDPHPDHPLVRGSEDPDPDPYQNVTDPQHWNIFTEIDTNKTVTCEIFL